MGTKNNPGKFDCYANAEPDEPMFVLLARDPVAAHVVRYWAWIREQNEPVVTIAKSQKLVEALECADAMDVWHVDNRKDETK